MRKPRNWFMTLRSNLVWQTECIHPGICGSGGIPPGICFSGWGCSGDTSVNEVPLRPDIAVQKWLSFQEMVFHGGR